MGSKQHAKMVHICLQQHFIGERAASCIGAIHKLLYVTSVCMRVIIFFQIRRFLLISDTINISCSVNFNFCANEIVLVRQQKSMHSNKIYAYVTTACITYRWVIFITLLKRYCCTMILLNRFSLVSNIF